MADVIRDLWPEGIVQEIPRTPGGILRSQAALLGKKTKNLVQGYVESMNLANGRFVHELQLTVPVLSGYRYRLLTVEHDISLYPARVAAFGEAMECPDEDSFLEALEHAFAMHNTRRVIAALMAQAAPELQETSLPGRQA